MHAPETVHLPRQVVNQILAHVQSAPDTEVCGLISAVDKQAKDCYPVANIAAQAGTRYHMDPAAQIASLRAMRAHNETLFAIYHSHPTSHAAPSATDIAEAAYPDALYLIISLNTRGVLEMRCFRIQKGNSHELILAL